MARMTGKPCTLALGLLLLAAAASAGELDGTAWAVKVTPDEDAQLLGEKAFDDTLTFAEGKVSMSECTKAGFAVSDYQAKGGGDRMFFSTEQTSAAQGKSYWKAEITGTAIRGTLVWMKKDGKIVRYTFAGQKQ